MSARKRIDLDAFVRELKSRSGAAKNLRNLASQERERAALAEEEAAQLRKMSYEEVWELRQRIEEREKRISLREEFLRQAKGKRGLIDALEKSLDKLFKRPLPLDEQVQRLWERPDITLRRKGNEIHISMGVTHALVWGKNEKPRFIANRIRARAVADSAARSSVSIEIVNWVTPIVDEYRPGYLYISCNNAAFLTQVKKLERDGFGVENVERLRERIDTTSFDNAVDAFDHIASCLMLYLTSPLGAHYTGIVSSESGDS